MSHFNMIADEQEIRWFFDHAIFNPTPWEAYALILVHRRKKLSPEDRIRFGLSSSESAFLVREVIRAPKFKNNKKSYYDNLSKQVSNKLFNHDFENIDKLVNECKIHSEEDIKEKENFSNPLTADKFIKHVKKLNVDKEAYAAPNGDLIPDNSMVVMFYINPSDLRHAAYMVEEELSTIKENIVGAMTTGKRNSEIIEQYQAFGNIFEDWVKYMTQCRGSSYWLDFDIDVPEWMKEGEYFKELKNIFTTSFGRGNFIMISTGGGYHVMVRTFAIRDVLKGDPHKVSELVRNLYEKGIAYGNPKYINEKGEEKFECVIVGEAKSESSKSTIPCVPLPGTYQYCRPVIVVNKEDFE